MDERTCVPLATPLRVGSASAFVIGWEGQNTFALTAAHVCEPPAKKDLPIPIGKFDVAWVVQAREFSGQIHMAQVVRYDTVSDLCLLRIKKILEVVALPIGQREPVLWDRVYSTQSPAGIARPGSVPLYEGFYSGSWAKDNRANLFTVYSYDGSSGSPVIDVFGNVVGVLSMGGVRVRDFCLSPTLSAIRIFLGAPLLEKLPASN